MATRSIEHIVTNRQSPEDNPFTFFSCTNQDSQVEWMKTCEEKAPYCAEFDDYEDESREVLRDQGEAFPYSFGMHLVAQIVAAFNPHDLDVMDESVPFSRRTLDDLLGYRSSPEEYRYYFDKFIEAQRRKVGGKPFEVRFARQLPSLYGQFETAVVSADIPAVQQYKQEMKSYSPCRRY